MVIHIKDAYTDARVRLLAQRRGIGLTAAIKEAVDETLAKDEQKLPPAARVSDLRARLQPLFDRIDAMPRTGAVLDKRFYDELWGQEDDD